MSNDSTPPISPKTSLDIQDNENDIKPNMSNYNIIKDINLYSIYLNNNKCLMIQLLQFHLKLH